MIKDSDLMSICLDQDFITSDKYLNHTLNCGFCAYIKTDLYWKGGLWRGNKKRSFFLEKRKGKSILICGHSDHSMTPLKSRLAKIKGYQQVYGVNLNPIQGGTYSLPLGLTNATNESDLHRLFGDTEDFLPTIESLDRPSVFTNNIYANFSIQTNKRDRTSLARILGDLNKTVNSPIMTKHGRLEYLHSLRAANFVVCPEGNGVDTHRIWECLYLNVIPIVIKIDYPNFENLPIIVLDSWNDIDIINDYSFTKQCSNKLTINNYKEMIESLI
jgi:hypothetical protein